MAKDLIQKSREKATQSKNTLIAKRDRLAETLAKLRPNK